MGLFSNNAAAWLSVPGAKQKQPLRLNPAPATNGWSDSSRVVPSRHGGGGARRELGCTAASRFIFDVEIKVTRASVMRAVVCRRADRVSKKQHRPKICGIPPWAPRMPFFWRQILSVLRGKQSAHFHICASV